jgi:hypothetical protein
MAAQIENLWGEEIIGEEEDITLPKTILKHQAKYLKKISRNILDGEVITSSDEHSHSPYWAKTDMNAAEFKRLSKMSKNKDYSTFNHDFYITLPDANYRYRLLGVSHEIDLYPLIVHGYLEEKNIKANNEEEFKNILSQLFRSPKTQRILNILTSQAKA